MTKIEPVQVDILSLFVCKHGDSPTDKSFHSIEKDRYVANFVIEVRFINYIPFIVCIPDSRKILPVGHPD